MKSMHVKVTDTLGHRIVNGEMPVDSVLSLAGIEKQFGVSRTVAREAMLRLLGLGMLDVHRRVGLRVTNASKWNVLSPQVIAWRLDGPDRDSQLRSLTELRVAIEPMAGRLAALHASDEERQRLMELAIKVQEMGSRGLGQTDEYLFTYMTGTVLVIDGGMTM